MRSETKILLHVLLVSCETFVPAYYFYHFLGARLKQPWGYMGFYGLYFAANFYVSMYASEWGVSPYLTIAFCCGAAVALYKGSLFQRLFAAGLLVAYMFVTETLSAVSVSWITGYVFPQVPEPMLIYFLSAFISKACLLLIVFIILYKRKAILLPVPVSHRAILLIIVVICTFLTFADMQFIVALGDRPSFLHVVSELGIVTLSVVSFYVFEKFQHYTQHEVHANLLEQQILQDEKHFQYMDAFQREIRGMKHDFTNHLISMRQLLSNQNYPALEDYLQKYIKDISTVFSETFTGCASADALITVKKKAAEAAGIQFSVKSGGVEAILINAVHLNIVLSNILDNAIEACEKLPATADRRIELGLKTEDGFLYVRVINTSPHVSWVAGDSLPHTTKEDQLHHGLGLGITKNLVERYGGTVYCESGEGEFLFAASMENEERPIVPYDLYAVTQA